MINKLALFVFCVSLLAGCGQQTGSEDGPDAAANTSFEATHAAAERALAEAEARRNAWSGPEVLLRASEAAFEGGRVHEAIELATEAKLLAELALAQADAEKDAWRSRVLSD